MGEPVKDHLIACVVVDQLPTVIVIDELAILVEHRALRIPTHRFSSWDRRTVELMILYSFLMQNLLDVGARDIAKQ